MRTTYLKLPMMELKIGVENNLPKVAPDGGGMRTIYLTIPVMEEQIWMRATCLIPKMEEKIGHVYSLPKDTHDGGENRAWEQLLTNTHKRTR